MDLETNRKKKCSFGYCSIGINIQHKCLDKINCTFFICILWFFILACEQPEGWACYRIICMHKFWYILHISLNLHFYIEQNVWEIHWRLTLLTYCSCRLISNLFDVVFWKTKQKYHVLTTHTNQWYLHNFLLKTQVGFIGRWFGQRA